MTFIQAHWGVIALLLWYVATALYKALPATTTDFKWGQFFLDWLRGILGFLPSTAPKLTSAQRATVGK